MNTPTEPSLPSVNVDFGASAKLEVKTEIPSEASGRLVHALVDALSPFTETLGLAGDHIRAIREKRAIDRLVAANVRILEANRTPNPVPDVFLIPWAEKTSQDEGDDGLSEAWINLLTSAATDYSPRMKSFPSILSELTGEDVRFLEELCTSDQYDDRQIAFEINSHLTAMQGTLGNVQNPQLNSVLIKSCLDRAGQFFAGKSLEVNGIPGKGCVYTNSQFYDRMGSGMSVIEKNGLIISFTEVVHASHIRLDITYVKLTRLGFEFVQACRGLK